MPAFLLGARITEMPPFNADRVAERRITFSLVLDSAPVCQADRTPSSFAFLIDADRSTATGTVRDGTRELGVDAEIPIRCDVASGRFFSPIGDVDVRQSPDADREFVLSVTTRVGRLPSLEFDWIAIASDEGRVSRIPGDGRAGVWRVLERWATAPASRQ